MLASYPVEKIWRVILLHAQEGGSSCIHIEPSLKQTQIRYRTQAGLSPSLYLPEDLHYKLAAHLKTFSDSGEEEEAPLQIEFLPTGQGEKIFVRLPELFLNREDLEGEADDLLREIKNETKGLVLFKLKAKGLFETILNKLRMTEKKVVHLVNPFKKKLKGADQIVIKPEIGLNHSTALDLAKKNSAQMVFLPEVIRPELTNKILSASQNYLLFTFLPATRLEPLADWLGLKGRSLSKKDFFYHKT